MIWALESMSMNLQHCETTNGVKVTVEVEHLSDASQPHFRKYAFAYTITIENVSEESVRLLERHWIVCSGGKPLAEVIGPGVVGEQPEIIPGASFSYTSGAVIEDPIGSMQGSYTFRSEAGNFFQANIPKFDLFYPVIMH